MPSKMTKNQFYCVSCRARVKLPADKICIGKDKNKKPRLVGKCANCSVKVFRYVAVKDVKKLQDEYKKC